VQSECMQVREALCLALINTCKSSLEQALTLSTTKRVQEVVTKTCHVSTALFNDWGKSEFGEAFRKHCWLQQTLLLQTEVGIA